MSEPESESLTGVWHGQYRYPLPLEPVHFTATIIDSGGALSGTTQETAGLEGMPVSKMAILDGRRDGSTVRFVKTYAPASEEFQDVIYTGSLNGELTEIEGEWTVPGIWSGTFLMIRTRGRAMARERDEALTV